MLFVMFCVVFMLALSPALKAENQKSKEGVTEKPVTDDNPFFKPYNTPSTFPPLTR